MAGGVLLPALLGLLLGLIAGSFVATLVLRWPQERSIGGRSRCDGCARPLRWFELVPLLSWALARGQCRSCGAKIDPRHPAIEACAGLIGLAALLVHPNLTGLVSALLGWWLLAIAALDGEHHWLPDRLTLPMIPLGLLVGWARIGPALGDRAIGALVGFVALAAIAWAYRTLRGREGMGGGDPKLLAALGAWLGWAQLPFVLVGAGLVGLAAVAWMALRGRAPGATDRLPLGALMALAAWPIWLAVAG